MPTKRNFPGIKPSSRSYSPGSYPQQQFEALNGVKTTLRYGQNRTDATLALGFSNISDAEAALILENYEDVNSNWDYVTFTSADGVYGVSDSKDVDGQTNPVSSLQSLVKEGGSGLKWRYSGPPTVTSTFKGFSNVSCSFVACLDSP